MVAKNKILITGSNGLIGNTLERYLRKIGIEVKGIDISYPSTHPNHKNIQDLESIKEAAADCRGIVHLAAVSRVILGEQNPTLCWKTNIEGTRNILEAVLHLLHKPWVIYASSREVYGQQAILPVTEKAPLLPLNTYARSKVMGEKLVLAYREKDVQTAILRFSNVYGSVNDYS